MDDTDAALAMEEAEPVVRRVVAARVPAADVDDLVQEAMGRLLVALRSGTVRDVAGYAAIAARNAAASHHRTSARRRDLEARSLDLSEPESPEAALLGVEEADGLRSAVGDLDTSERELVRDHHLEGHDLGLLARRSGRSEMAVRLSLARARAKLRVGYVLAYNQVTLPTSRCRPVLLALSSGDRRAQRRLDTSDHLTSCPTCAGLAAPAQGARRPAVAVVPLLLWWWKGLTRGGRRLALGGAGAAAVALGAVVVLARPEADRPPTRPPTVAAAAPTTDRVAPAPVLHVRIGGRALGSTPAALGAASGRQVVGTAARVLEVPADEGFWIALDDGGRIWAQLVGGPDESPIVITAGAVVTFEGRLAAHDPSFPASTGLSGPAADELASAGHHLEISTSEIELG